MPEYQKHSSVVAALGALGIADLDHLLSREGLMAPGGQGGGGFAGRRTMGVMLEEMKVSELVEGGAAARAGVKVGDVIVKVGGKPVATREEYVEVLQGAGREIAVIVRRDGQEVELKLTFTAPQP